MPLNTPKLSPEATDEAEECRERLRLPALIEVPVTAVIPVESVAGEAFVHEGRIHFLFEGEGDAATRSVLEG